MFAEMDLQELVEARKAINQRIAAINAAEVAVIRAECKFARTFAYGEWTGTGHREHQPSYRDLGQALTVWSNDPALMTAQSLSEYSGGVDIIDQTGTRKEIEIEDWELV